MKNILLVAVDAKYIHTNLAVRSVRAYATAHGLDNISIAEFTINHHPRAILQQVAARRGDVVVFSCYIWNIELVRQVAASLRKLHPDTLLVAAGPEVSCHSADFLRENPFFDAVLSGEGEAAGLELFRCVQQDKSFTGCAGLVWRGQDGIHANPPPPPLELDELPFAYDDLAALDGRIIYYESMRGCPFSCAYCLSSIEKGVRMRSAPRVFADLQRLLDAQVRQVKLVDRTFNCNKTHAMAVWQFLHLHDNGVTNFHFELAGELLDDEMIAFLATVRPGQFQFEIGVQSTNPRTLKEISRPGALSRLFEAVRSLREPRNIHLHLDLIAGLPLEDFGSFVRSFNEVYALAPDQLQLGFLKVLKGSAIERDADAYGLIYEHTAPYEVLQTRWLSFDELVTLSGVEHMLDSYYNNGRFTHILGLLVERFGMPFAFYHALWQLYVQNGHEQAPLSKLGYYDLLGALLHMHGFGPVDRAQWLCKYDVLLHEKPRKLPGWVDVDLTAPYRGRILAFLAQEQNLRDYLPQYIGIEAKHIVRVAHVEVFPFDPRTGREGEVVLLFDYARRDIAGRALVQEIILDV